MWFLLTLVIITFVPTALVSTEVFLSPRYLFKLDRGSLK